MRTTTPPVAAATQSSSACVRPATTTRAPAPASASAIERPMPRQLLVIDTGDDLDDAERARLDAALEDAAESIDRGEGIGADEAIRRLRAAAGTMSRTG